MKKLIILLISTLYAFNSFAQDQMPDPGFSLGNYLADNVNYPQDLRDKGVQGVVHVKFIVTSTGKLDSIRLIKKLHPTLDKEAVRVVKSMPNWKPGKVNGVAVNSSYIIPFHFNLGDGKPEYVHPKQPINGPILTYADQMPEPDFDMVEYFSSQKLSLSGDVPTDVKGKVIVSFVVREDGDADNIKIVRSLHPVADSIAIRYIENMPLWIPGRHNGNIMNVQYTMPISFNFADLVNTDTSDRRRENNITAIAEDIEHGWDVPQSTEDEYVFPKPTFNLGKYRNELVYPAYCQDNGIQGVVKVKFAIDKLGYVTDIEILSAGHKMLAESMLKWLREMPRWQPATKNGEPIKVYRQFSQKFLLYGSNYHSKENLFNK